MGYVPKFIHLDHFIVVEYPFGVHWKHSYIQQSAEAIFNAYKEEALIITVLGLLPIANIILFAVFIIYYAIHAGWNPNEREYYTHVFSLKGKNAITRCLLAIKNLLCRKI